jgi:hypothetical protein
MTQKVVTNDEEVTGATKFFFAIFGTFGRYVTNLRGTFVENVKKVQNQPTLLWDGGSIYSLQFHNSLLLNSSAIPCFLTVPQFLATLQFRNSFLLYSSAIPCYFTVP